MNAGSQALPFRPVAHWLVLTERMARELEKSLHDRYSGVRVSMSREIFAFQQRETVLLAAIASHVSSFVTAHEDWQAYLSQLHPPMPSDNPADELPATFQVSTVLSRVVGKGRLSRSEVFERLWDYIRKHRLQDRINDKLINADENLRAVFGGKGKVSKFEMMKLVENHLSPGPDLIPQSPAIGDRGPPFTALMREAFKKHIRRWRE